MGHLLRVQSNSLTENYLPILLRYTIVINVGIVGLDTSHPEAFAEYLQSAENANVAAVWDGGDVRSGDYAESFCDRFDATLYGDSTKLTDAVDAAMVLTANWDSHARLVVPFLKADVPTFVDKPLAGRLRDVEAIAEAVGDTPLFGGSAIPFHPALDALPVGVADRTLFCAGYNDPFYYGVHLADTARRLAGSDWSSVALVSDPGVTVAVEFENGTRAELRLDGSQEDSTFAFLDVEDETRTASIDSDATSRERMYGQFLDAFLDAVRGDRDDSRRILDGARLLLAIHAALDADDVVTPESDSLRQFHADGDAFLADYAPYY